MRESECEVMESSLGAPVTLGSEEGTKLDVVLTKAGLLHLKPLFLQEKV